MLPSLRWFWGPSTCPLDFPLALNCINFSVGFPYHSDHPIANYLAYRDGAQLFSTMHFLSASYCLWPLMFCIIGPAFHAELPFHRLKKKWQEWCHICLYLSHIYLCNLLLFGFHVLSVCRSHREFNAKDTISLMVWGGVGMVLSLQGMGVG